MENTGAVLTRPPHLPLNKTPSTWWLVFYFPWSQLEENELASETHFLKLNVICNILIYPLVILSRKFIDSSLCDEPDVRALAAPHWIRLISNEDKKSL